MVAQSINRKSIVVFYSHSGARVSILWEMNASPHVIHNQVSVRKSGDTSSICVIKLHLYEYDVTLDIKHAVVDSAE